MCKRRDLILCRSTGQEVPAGTDIYWTYNIPPGHPDRSGLFSWIGHSPPLLQRKSNFTCGKSDDVMNHALQAFGTAFPSLASVFVILESGEPVSASRVLLDGLVALNRTAAEMEAACLNLMTAARELRPAATIEREYGAYLHAVLTILIAALETGVVAAPVIRPFVPFATLASTLDGAGQGHLAERLASLAGGVTRPGS